MITQATIIDRFRAECPGMKIRAKIKDYKGEPRPFMTKKRDATRAVAGDACHCTMSNAVRNSFRIPAAIFEYRCAYLLEPLGQDHYEVVRYVHDGRNVAKALDEGGSLVWNTTVTLRKPPKRRPNAERPAVNVASETARKRDWDAINRPAGSPRRRIKLAG